MPGRLSSAGRRRRGSAGGSPRVTGASGGGKGRVRAGHELLPWEVQPLWGCEAQRSLLWAHPVWRLFCLRWRPHHGQDLCPKLLEAGQLAVILLHHLQALKPRQSLANPSSAPRMVLTPPFSSPSRADLHLHADRCPTAFLTQPVDSIILRSTGSPMGCARSSDTVWQVARA